MKTGTKHEVSHHEYDVDVKVCDVCGGDATQRSPCSVCGKDLCGKHQIEVKFEITNCDHRQSFSFHGDKYEAMRKLGIPVVRENIYCKACLIKEIEGFS